MNEGRYTLFDEVKMEKEGKIFTGVKIRKALNEDGYCVKSVENPQEVSGFITEKIYQVILNNEEVTIHV